MRFGVLGPVRVWTAAGAVDVGGARQRRLLAALVLQANEVASTDRLLDIVFEGAPPSGAATTIRSYVARLRKALGEAEAGADQLVSTEQGGYRLQVDIDALDSARFEASIETARGQLGERDPIGAAATLRAGLAIWRGDAYGEFAFEDWARPEVLRLEELRTVAEEELDDALLACGLAHDVVSATRAQIAEHPLRERLRAQHALALYRAGRQVEALRSLEEFQRALVEVGLEPSEELLRLGRSIAAHDPSLRLDSPAGSPLRGYRVGAALGEGAHGVVHRAVQPGVGREVAIKTIRAPLADDPEFIRRFDAEAQLVANLEHPHVVPIYDYWREPGGAYIVMRLLDDNLGARLATGPMDVETVATIARQLGSALAAAHRAGVVHGDIKPSNVLVDESTAYLADFGVASLVEWADRDGAAYPSSGYESPELLAGEPPSRASDQFALAVLLVQLLTGRLPFGTRAIATPHDRSPSIHAQRRSVPATVDDVVWRATAWAASDRYPDVETFVDHFDAALAGRAQREPRDREVANPYRGLRAFTEIDRAVFFGREPVVDELVERLAGDVAGGRFVVAIGPSGSGKSSVLRAGLLPRLRSGAVPGSQDWLIATMTPGSDPFAELDTALRSVATTDPGPRATAPDDREVLRLLAGAVPSAAPVLLVIDQLEELFTQVADESVRRPFVAALARAIHDPDADVRVVATMRADFLDRPLRYAEFGQLVKHGAVTIVGMSAPELEVAITRPAAAVGVEVQPALATQLVADVLDQPAALPLLQFTLTELFERRSGPVLTLDDYRSLGGVSAAVAGRADAVYGQLTATGRELARRMFLRLVTVDDARSVSRRRSLRSDLVSTSSDPVAMDALIDAFGTSRLLTFDRDHDSREPTVEIAHEALIDQWPRFAGWVAGAGEGLRIQNQLAEAARTWEQHDRDGSDLYRGLRLESALEWADAQPEASSPLEREFLTASADARTAAIAAARRQAERDERTNRRLRGLLAGVGVLLVVAIVAGLIAVDQRNSSRDAAAAADVNARTARVGELAAASAAHLDTDPELSTLLAVEAVEAAKSPESDAVANQALHDAVLATRVLGRLPGASTGVASFHPDGDSFLTGYGDESMAIWGGRPIERRLVLDHGCWVQDGEFSPDGSRIATTCFDGALRIWDTETGSLAQRFPTSATAITVVPTWSNDGTMVAASVLPDRESRAAFQPGEVHVWDTSTGELLHVIAAPTGARQALNLEFSPNDQLLATTFFVEDNEDAALWVWNVGTWELAHTYIGHLAAVTDVGFTPDGRKLVTVSVDATARMWDVDTEAQLGIFGGHVDPLRDVEISPDGTRAASSGFDVRLWDLDTFAEVGAVIHHRDADGLDFSPDGRQLLTSSHRDRFTMLWDITPEGRYEKTGFPVGTAERVARIDILETPPGGIAFDPRGVALATRGTASDLAVFDLRSGGELAGLDGPGEPLSSIAYSDDGELIAAAGPDGARIWSTETWTETASVREGERVHALTFRPGTGELTVAGEFGIETWAPDGQVTRVSDSETMAAAYDHGGSRLLFHEVYGELVLVDARSASRLAVVDSSDDSGKVAAVAFSPDDSLVAIAGQEVAIWRIGPPPERVGVLEGHGTEVHDAAFTSDGNGIVTVAGDGLVRVWDIATGSVRLTFTDPGATDLDLSADGQMLATVSNEGTATVLLLDTDHLVAEARRRLTRTWTESECAQYRIDRCDETDGSEDERS